MAFLGLIKLVENNRICFPFNEGLFASSSFYILIVRFSIFNLATTPTPGTTSASTTPYPQPQLFYQANSDYHWPDMQVNATKIIEIDEKNRQVEAQGLDLTDGPFGFGKAVNVTANKCLIDNDYLKAGDKCARNPANCPDGFTVSIWEKNSVDDYVLVPLEENVENVEPLPRKYLVSSGASFNRETGFATPGFAIYRQVFIYCQLSRRPKQLRWRLSLKIRNVNK